MTTWREELEALMRPDQPLSGLSIDDFTIATVPGGLDQEFDDNFGSINGPMFMAWSDDWVVIATDYDGAESLQAVPRNPTVKFDYHDGFHTADNLNDDWLDDDDLADLRKRLSGVTLTGKGFG